MTQFILDMAVPTAKRQLDFVKNKDIIEEKAIHTENQLQEVKKKMEQRRVKPKSLFETVFARKS